MKATANILITAILLSACSKTVKTVHYESWSPQVQSKNGEQFDFLKPLIVSSTPNHALAELLAQTVAIEHRDEVTKILAQLSASESLELVSKFERDSSLIREKYLYHGQAYQNNDALLENVLRSGENYDGNNWGPIEQLRFAAFGYVKSKALDEIIATYDRRSAELAEYFAKDIAYDIARNHPGLAEEIDQSLDNKPKRNVLEMITSSKPFVEKVDLYFRTSKLNENEQYIILMSGILASSIYSHVKDHKGFKHLLAQGKKIVRDIREVHQKANELSTLIYVLSDHFESTKKNVRRLEEGLIGAKNELTDLYSEAQKFNGKPRDVNSKNIMDFLYKKVMLGKDVEPNGTNKSILSKQVTINKNVQKSIIAAGELTNNLSNIITTTQRVAALLGIKTSTEVNKALDKAQKVASIISTVQVAVTGFGSGGVLGAISALGSGPMQNLLGGGGSMESVKLDEISRKLDIVIKNQQVIIELQRETMHMIKELAVMIDKYHQQEMAALAELRDLALLNQEFNRAALHKDIRACERLISYQISSNMSSVGKVEMSSLAQIDHVKNHFYGSIKSLDDVRKAIKSVEGNGFETCQTAMAEAFGSTVSSESPLLAIFASEENAEIYAFNRDYYIPALNALKDFAETNSFGSVPLHLPVKTFKGLSAKRHYIEMAKHDGGVDWYQLENLVSVKTLERYLGGLLILHPLLEVDRSTWNKNASEVVSNYLLHATEKSGGSRGAYLLTKALQVVQTGIAQESILAGEPLLPWLSQFHAQSLLSISDCSKGFFLSCSLRNNKLLMKNLLNYVLFEKERRFGIHDQYQNAYSKGDLATLANLISLIPAKNLKVLTKNGEQRVILSVRNLENELVEVQLPTPGELTEGRILYSENMARLLKMQDLLLDALEKVTPVQYGKSEDEIIKTMLLRAAM